MARLLEELKWSDTPLVAPAPDPDWEARLAAAFDGRVPTAHKMLAPSPWVREAFLDFSQVETTELGAAYAEVAGLVTSQENACRYCYGVARMRMRMFGFTEQMVDDIERRVQLSEADARERELVSFCRDLARSRPRPSKEARDRLHAVGINPLATAELAFVVASVGFLNRVSTLLAVPMEPGLEEMPLPKGWMARLAAWIPARAPARPPAPAPRGDSRYHPLVAILEGTPAAPMLERAFDGAFSSTHVPLRTTLLIFAVVARTLRCRPCETLSVDQLAREGLAPAEIETALSRLASPSGDLIESLVLPWARDTVWMPEQPWVIQERTRPLREALGERVLLDVVGAAALANASVRLGMLLA